jgi:hypothetical protein
LIANEHFVGVECGEAGTQADLKHQWIKWRARRIAKNSGNYRGYLTTFEALRTLNPFLA